MYGCSCCTLDKGTNSKGAPFRDIFILLKIASMFSMTLVTPKMDILHIFYDSFVAGGGKGPCFSEQCVMTILP